MVNFLNVNPCIPSFAFRFRIWYIFVLFWLNLCVFLLSVLLWILQTILPRCLSIWIFLCSLGCHNLLQNCSISLTTGYWYAFMSFLPTSLFWNILSCLYCFTLCRYLFNLISFAVTFFYFLNFSCYFFLYCFFLSCPNMLWRFSIF